MMVNGSFLYQSLQEPDLAAILHNELLVLEVKHGLFHVEDGDQALEV